jgi:predicted dehydrogenase
VIPARHGRISAKEEQMQRVGVIGMGPIGNRHATIYKELPDVELVAVCDRVAERADAASARLGVPAFYSVADMLAGADLTMVSVATGGIEYGSDHYEPTMQALGAGLHVLCEKPICNEIGPAAAMVACARERGLCFGVDLNHRFTPAARLARKWVDEGLIGHQLFVNMSMWIQNPRESSPWFHIKALHPHTIDVMRYFCGDIDAVHCFATRAPGRKIWSTAQFNLRFVSGCVGHLTGSYDIERGHPMERCEVAGLKGRFVLDDMWREVTLYPAGDPVKRVYSTPVFGGFGDFVDTFRDRLGTFVRQVNANVAPEDIDGSGEDGLRAQRVLAAAIESIETGEAVSVAN